MVLPGHLPEIGPAGVGPKKKRSESFLIDREKAVSSGFGGTSFS